MDSEVAHAKAVAEGQSEAEDINERLFELRVELQNLADDTNISVASISRKVCMITCVSMAARTFLTVWRQ